MTSWPRGTSTANRASASCAPHRRRPPRSVRSMDRGESGVDRQICNQPLDLPPAREVDVVAKRAILLGARRGGEAGLLAMVADQRLCIVDRGAVGKKGCWQLHDRSEEHTSELQSLMRISYAVFCLKKKKTNTTN